MSKTATISFSLNRTANSHRTAIALINAHHQLKISGAPASKLEDSRAAILATVDEVENETKSRWLKEALLGEAYHCFGEEDRAIASAKKALSAARSDDETAKALNNLCEYHRQAGHFDEAVKYGQMATQKSGGKNLGMVITWAEAMFEAGDWDRSESLLREVAKVSRINEPGDVLGTHLRFEHQLHKMTQLPTVKALFAELA